MIRILLATLVTAPLLLPPAAQAAGPVTGFIVQWREAAPRTVALRAGAVLTGRWQRVHAGQALSADEAAALAARLRADPDVLAVVPDVREQRQDSTPSDPRYAEQWWLQAPAAGNTGAAHFTRAWDVNRGDPVSGSGAAVAVLDSGITSHPELNARLLPGYDFVRDTVYAGDGNGRDNDPADPGDAITAADRTANPTAFSGCAEQPLSSWHGTTIAGMLAAVTDNAAGVAAANWRGTVLPVRVAGKCGAAVSDIVDAMRWAAGLAVAGVPMNPNPARLIVLSYGGTDPCDVNSSNPDIAATARLYVDAIAEVRQAGALVVAAAGNLRVQVGRPAACSGAFAVASLNREGYKSAYSNLGAQIALATPGGDGNNQGTCDAQLADTGIVSTGNLGDTVPGSAGYVAASGTSFAAPAVAAAAALMLAVNPALSVAQIEDGLKRSARPHLQVPLLRECSLADNRGRCACTSSTCGAGVLDAPQALAFAAAPASYTPPVRAPITLSDSRLRACAVILGNPIPPEPPTNPPPSGGDSGGGGGGAFAWPWLLALAVAVRGLSRSKVSARGPG
jgi:serine protease